MPELPEVEALRDMVEHHALGRMLHTIDVRDTGALHQTSARNLRETAEGRSFCKVCRHGKILIARIEDGPFLIFHFGMTGRLVILEADEDLPDHTRVVFGFGYGDRLVFDNPRKFGRLELAKEVTDYLRDNDIGPDALSVSGERFREIIGSTRGQVKPALMDQSKLAGIGNVYSDEILFRARLRPDAKGNDLSDGQLRDLCEAMRHVLETASDRLSAGQDLPGDWLAPHRGKEWTCPRCDADLCRKKISGRNAWFCPSCQHKAECRTEEADD
jgi:formamidopyrimidine-DNA glycosylase